MNRKISYQLKRKRNTRSEYKYIYIFTEGEKTEVNYFESKKREIETEIRRRNIKIEIKGTARNTLSLVDYALEVIIKKDIDLNVDECWVVFDKDSFDKNFDNAINKAEVKGLKVAYSNESFELWFLLHFSYMNSAIGNKEYVEKLNNEIQKINGKKYSKVSENIYELIKSREGIAIKNAKRLLGIYKKEVSFIKKNPSTTVHLLVDSLNKLKD